MWIYFLCLLTAATATLLLLVAALLRYLPHDMLVQAGLSCALDDGCASSLPVWAGTGFSFLMGGVIVGLVAFFVVSLCGQIGCSRRSRRHSSRVGLPFTGVTPARLDGKVLLVADPRPQSYAVGVLDPLVVVSSGLVDTLAAEELHAVLAHEEGHVQGRDNLVILLARTIALAFALVPGVRVGYAGVRRNLELAADLFAKQRVGDGLVVAASLHKFARLVLTPTGASLRVAAGFADEGHVGERIRGLLREDSLVTSKRRIIAAVAAFLIMLSGFAGSAAAFTQVTLAHDSDCAACHPDAVAVSPSVPDHEACVTEAH